MRIALIDGDIPVFQSAVACQKSFRFSDDADPIVHADPEEGEKKLQKQIVAILEEAECDRAILALSHSVNWRKGVLPTYKHNRSNSAPPVLRAHLKQYAIDNYECYVRPTLEGDDVLGILATGGKRFPAGTELVICSNDKDMKTIPGKHFNLTTGEAFEITEHKADWWHMYQTLIGDSVDGYTGLPGVGPVKATAALQKALDEGTPWANRRQLQALYWQHVVAAYEAKGLTEEDALVQARVARICRAEDYDMKKKEVILWTPPSIN